MKQETRKSPSNAAVEPEMLAKPLRRPPRHLGAKIDSYDLVSGRAFPEIAASPPCRLGCLSLVLPAGSLKGSFRLPQQKTRSNY